MERRKMRRMKRKRKEEKRRKRGKGIERREESTRVSLFLSSFLSSLLPLLLFNPYPPLSFPLSYSFSFILG